MPDPAASRWVPGEATVAECRLNGRLLYRLEQRQEADLPDRLGGVRETVDQAAALLRLVEEG